MTDLSGVLSRLDTIISKLDAVITSISNLDFSGAAGSGSDIMANNDQNTDRVLSGQQQMSQDIQANQDQNTVDILDGQQQMSDDIQDNQDKNTNLITSALSSLGTFIIDGIKGLFIPSDEFFKAYFDDLYGWFADRFGFLSFPIDLLVMVVDLFMNSSDQDCVLTLPGFTISGEQLLVEQSFNLTEFLESHFMFLLTACRTVSSIYLLSCFIHLCERKYNEVMLN